MHSDQWWATAPPHKIRCTAHYKSNGLPCRREAAPGTNVCNQHGALAPQVAAAAAVRVQMSADDAARKLLAMVEDPTVEHREKIKILQDILDRSGVTGVNKLLVGVVTQDPVEQLFQSLL